jgi:hypothetical protein
VLLYPAMERTSSAAIAGIWSEEERRASIMTLRASMSQASQAPEPSLPSTSAPPEPQAERAETVNFFGGLCPYPTGGAGVQARHFRQEGDVPRWLRPNVQSRSSPPCASQTLNDRHLHPRARTGRTLAVRDSTR